LERNQQLLELMSALGSSPIEHRVRVLHDLKNEGVEVLPTLVGILEHPDATMPSLVWTMMAIGQFGPEATDQVHAAVVRCLSSSSPTVRRAAIRTLGALRDQAAIDDIAALLADTTLDPSAWFDDDCTVAQTAEIILSQLRGDERPE
jgi:HEAT repeat protein